MQEPSLTFFCLLLFILPSTLIAQFTDKEISIKGKIYNFENKEKDIQVHTVNPGFFTSETLYSQVSEAGDFEFTLELDFPQDLILSYNNKSIKLILHPGDQIELVFDASKNNLLDFWKTVQFKGDAAILNSYLLQFQSGIYELMPSSNYVYQKMCFAPPQEYLGFRDSIYSASLSFAENFVKKHQSGSELSSWIKNEIQFSDAIARVDYPSTYAMHNGKNPFDVGLPENYYDFLNALPSIQQQDLINSNVVHYWPNNFCWSKIQSMALDKTINQLGQTKIKDNPIFDSVMVYTILETTQNDPFFRSLVLTSYFFEKLNQLDTNQIDRFSAIVNKNVTLPFLKQSLRNKIDEVKKTLLYPDLNLQTKLSSVPSIGLIDFLRNIKDSFPGQVIYIDVWATWCGPCLSEMPDSKRLQQKYSEKDLTFLFFCIDSEEKRWKPFISKFELTGIHYFLDKKKSTILREAFKVHGLPHYLIIDKNGKLVDSGSHLRPGHKSTEKILENLLND